MRGILKRHLALDGGIEDLEACSLKRKTGSLCTVVTVRRVLTSVALVRSCCIFYRLVPFSTLLSPHLQIHYLPDSVLVLRP